VNISSSKEKSLLTQFLDLFPHSLCHYVYFFFFAFLGISFDSINRLFLPTSMKFFMQ
jgi:hypothetical protein